MSFPASLVLTFSIKYNKCLNFDLSYYLSHDRRNNSCIIKSFKLTTLTYRMLLIINKSVYTNIQNHLDLFLIVKTKSKSNVTCICQAQILNSVIKVIIRKNDQINIILFNI